VATPALSFAADHLALTTWGLGFLTVGVLLTGALVVHKRNVYKLGLGVAIVWLCIWSALLAWSAIEGGGSPAGWVWPMFVARACWASLVSLEVGER
jgi:hypothetical protein